MNKEEAMKDYGNWGMVGRSVLVLALLAGCGGTQPEEGDQTETGPGLLVDGERGEAIIDIPGVGLQRVGYVVRNGVAYHAGDIEISAEDLAGLADPRTTAAGIIGEYKRWPNGVVPIEIDASASALGGPISTALAKWVTMTADGAGTPLLSFPAHTPGSPGACVRFVVDNTIPGAGSSPLGRQTSGVNTIKLRSGVSAITVMHEVGHSLGLYHEHQRHDRDSSMIVWDGTNGHANRIASAFVDDLKKYDGSGLDLAPGLDFSSIMLYPSVSGACSISPCLTKLDGVTTWNPASTISAGDADGIRRLYLQIAFSKVTFDDAVTPLKNIVLVTPQNTSPNDAHTLALRPADKHLVHYPLNGVVEDFGAVASSGTPGRFSAVAGNAGRFDWVAVTGTRTITHGSRSAGITSYETLASGTSTVGASIARQPNSTQLDLFAVFGSPPRIYLKSFIAGSWTGQCPAATPSACVDGWHVTRPTSGTITGGQIASVSKPDPNNKRLDVVAVTSLGIEHMYWTSVSGWQGPVTIASSAGGAVSITAVGGRRDVFHQNTSGNIFRTSFEGTWGSPFLVARGTDPTEISAAGRVVGSELLIDVTYHLNAPGSEWFRDTYRR
jgi:hypothetical protein